MLHDSATLLCWDDSHNENAVVHQAQLPPSEYPALVCPSGGLAVGMAGRRWLVVLRDGHAFVYAPGAEGGIEQELQIALREGDAPWRLSNSASSEVHAWVLTTRDGGAVEISFHGGELSARPLGGEKRSQWGSWISSLFSSSSQVQERILACCYISNNLWLVATDKNVLRAYHSFPEVSSAVWESEILAQNSQSPVVDMLFNFRLWQLFVLREGEAVIQVYRVEDDGAVVLCTSVGLSGPAGPADYLSLTESGNVTVRNLHATAKPASSAAGPAAMSASANESSMMLDNSALQSSVVMSVERAEQVSNELCGVFANDLWLPWAEKVNNVAFEKVGQILRSRVAKHRALFASYADNKTMAENNAALAATQGFFLGWNELLQAGEEEKDVQILKSDIVSVIGVSIGPSNTRRLAARNVHLFSMLWACCPVITHVLDLLKKFGSAQYPNRVRYWALRLLGSATLPLLSLPSPGALIKSDAILTFLEMPNLSSYGLDRSFLSQLAVAAVIGGTSKEQKVKALRLLEVFGPVNVYRSLCLEQGLCLVSIAVQDWKTSGGSNRESLCDFLANRPGFEEELWDWLVFGGQETLDVAVAIANDNGALADSLFRFLDKRPHLGVLALHSLQCKRFQLASAALVAQAEKEDAVLDRKKTLASLAFLAAKVGGPAVDAVEVETQLKVCRAAALVSAGRNGGVPLTREGVLQFCLSKLRGESDPGEVAPHMFAAAGLELSSSGEAEEILRLLFHKNDWKDLVYADDPARTVGSSEIGKLFGVEAPNEALFRRALKSEPEEIVVMVYQNLAQRR